MKGLNTDQLVSNDNLDFFPPTRITEGIDFNESGMTKDEETLMFYILEEFFFIKLLPWQERALALLMSGRFAEFSFIVARRNGKSYILLAFCVMQLLLGRRVIYTSYSRPSSTEFYHTLEKTLKTCAFANFGLAEILNNQELGSHLQALSSNKNHKVNLLNNGKLFSFSLRDTTLKISSALGGEVLAGTRSSGTFRGLWCDTLIFDESQNLTSKELAAFSPLVATSDLPLTIFAGTPSLDDDVSATTLASDLAKDFMSATPGSIHFEWSIDFIPTIEQARKPSTLKKYNPSFSSKGISSTPILSQLKQFKSKKRTIPALTTRSFGASAPEIFAVERLGFQSNTSTGKSTLLTPSKFSFLSAFEIDEIADSLPSYIVSVHAAEDFFVVCIVCPMETRQTFFEILSIFSARDEDRLSQLMDAISPYLNQNRCRAIVFSGALSSACVGRLKRERLLPPKFNGSKFGKLHFFSKPSFEDSCIRFSTLLKTQRCALYDTPFYTQKFGEVFAVEKNSFGSKALVGFTSSEPSSLVSVFSAFAPGASLCEELC